jgi:hypothetical protein
MLVSNYNIQYQIMSNVSIQNPNKKKNLLNTHFIVCLLFLRVCVSLIRL